MQQVRKAQPPELSDESWENVNCDERNPGGLSCGFQCNRFTHSAPHKSSRVS